MNVIKRICEKYPVEYNLMPDPWMRSVSLSFDSGVPVDLQDKIMEGLNQLGVFLEEMGIPMILETSAAKAGCYVLRVSGQEKFRFSEVPVGIPFAGYDMTESVIWTIYILAGRKDWLDDPSYRGNYVSCRCFSARQQATAAQISESVTSQYRGNIQNEKIQEIFRKLRSSVADFVMQAPRFSAQPIEESLFEKYKGRSMDATLSEIAGVLFGNGDFQQEIDAYCDLVCSSAAYTKQLKEVTAQLVETAYQLPIMAVSRLFTELGTLIDEIEPVSAAECSRLLRERVRFSLTVTDLKSCFDAVDKAYLAALQAKLETLFLRATCDQAHSAINREFSGAKQSIAALRNALGRFCFIRQNKFSVDDGAELLSWKQLSALEDRDIRHKDVSWSTESLNDLQSAIKSSYAPQLWLCSQTLCNKAEVDNVTDSHLTRAVPVLDEHVVWAVWVDPYREGV